jgi:hypothetical protein
MILLAGDAIAQTARPAVAAIANPAPAAGAAAPQASSFSAGQLRIYARDATLGDVLGQVASLTGVKIDIPPSARVERMPLVELGPGPARQVLATLFRDSGFDYLVQESDQNPEQIQNILLMARDKTPSAGPVVAAAPGRGTRSPFVKPAAIAPAEEPPAPPAAPPENTVAEAAPANPQPATDQPDSSLSTQPELSVPSQPTPIDRPKFPPTSPVPLPSVLNQQTMNQQLQQMYQQRMQMMQQEHGAVPPTARP